MDAAQAGELKGNQSLTSAPLQRVFKDFRASVPFVVDDIVIFLPLIENAAQFIFS